MRLRNNPDAHKILRKSNILIKSFPFVLNKETIVEFGMGKGKMITTLANLNKNNLFIGIEKQATIAEKALKKVNELGLKNLLIINDDLKNLHTFFKGEIKTIWLTFSDPWPKARHEKRRLTHKNFLDIYKKILHKNGVIKLKTDNDNFFNYSIASFNKNNWKLNFISRDFHSESFSLNNVMTEYEIKWSQEGKKINYLEARK